MTKKAFKRALLCGRGECMRAVREEPETFRALVLWGCTHVFAYDAQSEGSRGWYFASLIAAYADPTPFVETLEQAFMGTLVQDEWKFQHYAELLAALAEGGNRQAKAILIEKYRLLYAHLDTRKRRPQSLNSDLLFCMEQLCCALAPVLHCDGTADLAADIGRLMRTHSYMDALDFEWFYVYACNLYRRRIFLAILKNRAKTDPDTAYFLEQMCAVDEQPQQRPDLYSDLPQTAEEALEALSKEQRLPLYLVRSWLKAGKTEECCRLAEAALAAPDIKIQCTLLRQFGIYAPFPLSPLPLLPLARSSHEGLRTAVIARLSEATHPEIRRLALELAQETDREADAVLLLSRNFQPEDTGVLQELLRRLPTNQDNGWHGAYSAVLDMFGHGSPVRAPREFLSFLYENQRCSCCREDVLKQMSRRRMVTRELLEACRFDCNADIRLWAERKLKSFQK